MKYLSSYEIEKLLTDKWKEYKNLYENGRVDDKSFGRHGMFIIKSLQKELKDKVTN